nr:helix-turn-helix domain-containing protein [Ruegeria arenilitoris]
MEQNLETPLPTAQLAAISGVSVRQMERRFKVFLGQSPAAFYRSLRLSRAKHLVEQTALSLPEISVACGFANMTNFSKKYAKEFGLTPAKRRTQLLSVAPVPAGSVAEHSAKPP